MNTTYRSNISIRADAESTWKAICGERFVQDYLPEIHKDLDGMGDYVKRTHPRISQVGPDYTVPGQAMGWSTGAGTAIRLPRKDVEANIESVDIRLTEQGNFTRVQLEVKYAPTLGRGLLLAHRCVCGLFGYKLKVLKTDLEAPQPRVDWFPALA